MSDFKKSKIKDFGLSLERMWSGFLKREDGWGVVFTISLIASFFVGFVSSFVLNVGVGPMTIMSAGIVAALFSHLSIELNKEMKRRESKESRCIEIENKFEKAVNLYVSALHGKGQFHLGLERRKHEEKKRPR